MVFVLTKGDSMSIFTKEVDSGLEGKLPERKLRGWAKVPIYIAVAGTIGYFANKWTGDPTGLEKKLGVSSSQVSSQAKPPVKKMTPDLLRTELYKQKNLYLVWMIKANEKIPFPVGVKLVTPVVSDESHTAGEKYFLVYYDKDYNIQVFETDEAFNKDFAEGKLSYVTGTMSGPSTTTTQTNQSNQLLRMFR